MNRRHDIDALRALAFGLVILYHLGMYYVADWNWHLKSPHAAAWLQWPMRAVNLWRMDLVFLVSGLALAFLGRQPVRRLLAARSTRLLVPLAFGMAVVVPYQPYAQMVAAGVIEPGFWGFLVRYASAGPWPPGAFEGWEVGVTWNHLWYLPYLWLYTCTVLLLRPLLAGRLATAFRSLRGAGLLVAPVLPLWLASALLWPHFPPTHDLVGDGWLHAVYLTLFLYGWWIGTEVPWWAEAVRLRWMALALALLGLVAVLALRAALEPVPQAPAGLRLALRLLSDLYLWWALLCILGWAHRLLNRPWSWLPWANESVYPWYVLHQTLIILGAAWLAPMQLGPVAEPAMLLAGTVGGCWALTSVIRRSRVLRPLFGLRPPTPSGCPSAAPPARPGASSA